MPPKSPNFGGRMGILVPPILGVRGRLGEGLAKFNYLCVHVSLIKERGNLRRSEVLCLILPSNLFIRIFMVSLFNLTKKNG